VHRRLQHAHVGALRGDGALGPGVQLLGLLIHHLAHGLAAGQAVRAGRDRLRAGLRVELERQVPAAVLQVALGAAAVDLLQVDEAVVPGPQQRNAVEEVVADGALGQHHDAARVHVGPLVRAALLIALHHRAQAVLPHGRLAEVLALRVGVPGRHLQLVLEHRHQVAQLSAAQRLAQVAPVGHAQDQAGIAAHHVAPVPVAQLRPGVHPVEQRHDGLLPLADVVGVGPLEPRVLGPALVQQPVHGAESSAAAAVGLPQLGEVQRLRPAELRPGPGPLHVQAAGQVGQAVTHDLRQVGLVHGNRGHGWAC
jgi:hypothetical protein